MAQDEKDTIINIDVKYEDAVNGIVKYQNQIKDLKKSNDDLVKSNAEFKKKLDEGKVTQAEYNKEIDKNNKSLASNKINIDRAKEGIRLLEKEIKNNIKTEQEHEGSLVSLRASLSNLTKEYDNLSRAEREGAKGKEFQDKINAVTDELKEAEEGTQRFYRNVGNYKDTLAGLSGGIEGATKITQGFAQGMLGATSMMNLMGGASSDNAARMQQLQKVITLLSIAQQVNTNVLKEGIVQGKAAALVDSVRTLQAKARTAAEAASTKGTIAATVAQKIFNAVAALNPYVILAIALVTVVGALVLFASRTESAAAKQKKLNEQQRVYLEQLEREINGIDEVSNQRIRDLENEKRLLEARNASASEIIGIEEEILKARREAADESNKAAVVEIANLEANKQGLKELQSEYDRVQQRLADGANERNKIKITVDGKTSQMAVKDALDTLQKQIDNTQLKVNIATTEIQKQEDIDLEEKLIAEKRKQAAKDAQALLKSRLETERGLIRAAEDAALALVKDGIEKQRQVLNQSYDRQIEDLRRKLTEEKNLTAAAKQAVNDTILSIEKKRADDLDKLSDEETANRISKETQRISLMLEATKAGTQQEFDLRRQLLEQNRQAEIAANNALTEEMRQSEADINAKYDRQASELRDQQLTATAQKQSEQIQLEWQNRLLAVQQGSMEEYALKVQAAQSEHDFLLNLDAEQKAAMFESDLEYTNAVLQNKKKLEDATKAQAAAEQNAVQVQLQAAQAIGGGFEEVLNSFAESNEGLAEFAKAVALFNIGLSTAEAISKGVAAAQSVPFPGNIAAIASTIAAVMSNIAKAKQVLSKETTPKAPKLATGGMISGPGSGTSDSIQAFLSNGESVNTAMATSMFSPLYSALNQLGGGVPIAATQAGNQVMGEDMLARAFAKAVATLPSPVVSVEEIDNVGAKVTAIETLRVQ